MLLPSNNKEIVKSNDFPIVTAHKSENDTQAKGIKLITGYQCKSNYSS